MAVARRSVVRIILSLAIVTFGGCKSVPGTLVAAAAWTAVAGTASAVNRATGGCYAACTAGTICNPTTGLCEPLPCYGRCGSGERCEKVGNEERCMTKQGPALRFERIPRAPRAATSTAAGR